MEKQDPHSQRPWSRHLMRECLESHLYKVPSRFSDCKIPHILSLLKKNNVFQFFIYIFGDCLQTFSRKIHTFSLYFQVINQIFFAE